MNRIIEMFGLQNFAGFFIGDIVDEDRTEQRLFGFEIMRRGA